MLLCSECGQPASFVEGGRGLCHEDAQAVGVPRNPRPLTPSPFTETLNSTAPETGVSYSFTTAPPPANDSRAEEAP